MRLQGTSFHIMCHALAVTKFKRLFAWGNLQQIGMDPDDIYNEDGGFAGLFIVCAAAGLEHSAAIDSSGGVPLPRSFSLPLILQLCN